MTQASLFEPEKWKELRPLRPRQERAIEDIRQAVKEGHKRIIVQAPTGFGKTLTAAHLISNSTKKGKRPLFTCPAITLVNQTLRSFEDEGIQDIGVIQAQHERTDWLAQVQIASVQTLIRRALPEVDFVLIDEAHNQFDKLNELLTGEAWKDKIVIGLSATPWAKGMGLIWTKLIIAATVAELIEEGFLCPFQGFEPEDKYLPETKGIKITAGEFNENQAAAAMDIPLLVGNVVETWLKYRDSGVHTGDRTFLFAQNCAHAKSLRDEFSAAGISFGYIDAYSTPDERKETFRRFRSREDKGICSVGCLTTGVDEDVRVIIDAALTRSEITHVQKNGRGLRTADGKEFLLILDHAGNNRRLGTVTDIYHDHLDTRTKKDKGDAYKEDKPAKKPKKCGKCGALVLAGKRACGACGEKMVSLNTVQCSDGELVEFGSKKKSKAREFTVEQKQEFYSGLLHLAREHGRSDGMAAHRYKEKFGVWPNQLKKVASFPSSEVRAYDTHCRIKFVKSRRMQQAQVAG